MSQCYRKNSSFVSRCIAGETILVPVTSNVAQLDSVFTLNDTGTLIWGQLDGQTPLDQIAQAVAVEFRVSAREAERDALHFLGSLEGAGLISRSTEAGD
jgi:Coenzyme PQQ synthesis protein D (PqqD)